MEDRLAQVPPQPWPNPSPGPGNDKVQSQGGADRIAGGDGKDNIRAGGANDQVNSADGFPDKVKCGLGFDKAVVDDKDKVSNDCNRVTVK